MVDASNVGDCNDVYLVENETFEVPDSLLPHSQSLQETRVGIWTRCLGQRASEPINVLLATTLLCSSIMVLSRKHQTMYSS